MDVNAAVNSPGQPGFADGDRSQPTTALTIASATDATVPWISLEGVNGIGKTHLIRRAVQALGPRCFSLVELPDTPAAQLSGQIIAALQGGDSFLRTGVPRTETLLLAALHVHRYETAHPRPGQIVLEDRGPYTVAVYQSVILNGHDRIEGTRGGVAGEELLDTAHTVLDLITPWRPLPSRVLLLLDDPDRCLARFQKREGRTVRSDEAGLMRRVTNLYERLAAVDPSRFQLIDRRLFDEDQCVAAIVDACIQASLRESAEEDQRAEADAEPPKPRGGAV
ncbi:hypothetical protein AB0M95_40100 [Sphaerisporangium sp. NPDC051017]|uniref:dTMP kinase n=1 Tax=Sphaerisporangium sp. NPDC051017 TaxID=3154636 RepID=UPI00343A2DE8